MEPPKNKDVMALHPRQRAGVLAYLDAVNKAFPQYRLSVGETRRTRQRQQWLFAQNTRTHWVTNCDGVHAISMHQYGLATDFVLVRRVLPGVAIWDSRIWRSIYAAVPPAHYGLETISQELVHLQLAGSQAHVVGAGVLSTSYISSLGLTLT